jgi:GNAT superfamily N-acetyltransferase
VVKSFSLHSGPNLLSPANRVKSTVLRGAAIVLVAEVQIVGNLKGQRMALQLRPVTTRSERTLFETLPETLFCRDAQYVPPVPGTVVKVLDPKSHFRASGDVQAFIAFKDGQPAGRIAAFTNRRYNDYHHDKTGFFGLFDFIKDVEVAGALLEAATGWLSTQGCDKYRGPVNTPMGDEIGLLTDGFDSPPFILMPYNPEYYLEIYSQLGLTPVKNLQAYYISASGETPQRLGKVVDRIKKSSGIQLRSLNMKRLKAELKIIQDLYNETLDRNYGFIPLSEADLDLLASELRHVVNPELVMIAEKNGVPIGFSLVFPNINEFMRQAKTSPRWMRLIKLFWKLKTSSPKEARLAVLGVKKEYRNMGLGALFYSESLARGKHTYIGGELSWVEEDNKEIIRGISLMGGKLYKTYRVYENPIAPV